MDGTETVTQGSYTARLTDAEYVATTAKLERVNARAAKRGWTGGFTVTARRVTTTVINEFGFEVTASWWETTITGHAPSYQGWVFEAALDFDPEAGLITRPAPGVDRIDRDSIREGACDHCGITRDRRKIYLVRHTGTGETRQVGSTCIKDFLGWDGRVVFIPASDGAFSDGFGCGGEESGGEGTPAYATSTVLAAAWAATRAFGYHRSDGTDGTPTKTMVSIMLSPARRSAREREFAQRMRPYIDESYAQAAVISAYLASQAWPADSEYGINLKALLGTEHTEPRSLGLLVSAPSAWARAMEKETRRQALASEVANEHFGAVKERVTLTVRLRSIRYIEGEWGTTTLYTLITDAGHLVKYFASREILGHDATAGDSTVYMIKATIKGHDEYEGVKTTVITRAAVQATTTAQAAA